MKTLKHKALASKVLLGTVGLLVSGIMLACTTEPLPTEPADLSETGAATEWSDPDKGAISEVQAVKLDNAEAGADDSDAPQINELELPFRDIHCGEPCGFRVEELHITFQVSECEPGDPCFDPTIPFKPDKVHEIVFDNLIFITPSP